MGLRKNDDSEKQLKAFTKDFLIKLGTYLNNRQLINEATAQLNIFRSSAKENKKIPIGDVLGSFDEAGMMKKDGNFTISEAEAKRTFETNSKLYFSETDPAIHHWEQIIVPCIYFNSATDIQMNLALNLKPFPSDKAIAAIRELVAKEIGSIHYPPGGFTPTNQKDIEAKLAALVKDDKKIAQIASNVTLILKGKPIKEEANPLDEVVVKLQKYCAEFVKKHKDMEDIIKPIQDTLNTKEKGQIPNETKIQNIVNAIEAAEKAIAEKKPDPSSFQKRKSIMGLTFKPSDSTSDLNKLLVKMKEKIAPLQKKAMEEKM